jgi:putative transposase
MGRQLRILFPGAVYHLTSRGNERKNIFRDDIDRKKMLKIVGEAKGKYDFKLFVYTLMSNHYHFLIKTEKTNLPLIMQYVNTSYGIYFNRKYKRSGHLFQSRYKSILVEHGPDIKEVVRYIHLNPIRAKMCEELTKYPWSSHGQYTGARENGIADVWHVLKFFGESQRKAVRAYEKFMAEGERKDRDGDAIGAYGQYILGSEDFIRKIKLMVKDKKVGDEIVNRTKLKNIYSPAVITKAAAEYYGKKEEEMKYKKTKWNPGRKVLIYLLARDAGMKNSEIAEYLGGVHHSGIGKMTALVSRGVLEKKKICGEIKKIEEKYLDKKAS